MLCSVEMQQHHFWRLEYENNCTIQDNKEEKSNWQCWQILNAKLTDMPETERMTVNSKRLRAKSRRRCTIRKATVPSGWWGWWWFKKRYFTSFAATCVRQYRSLEWGTLYLYHSVPFTGPSESEQHKLIRLLHTQHEITCCCCGMVHRDGWLVQITIDSEKWSLNEVHWWSRVEKKQNTKCTWHHQEALPKTQF